MVNGNTIEKVQMDDAKCAPDMTDETVKDISIESVSSSSMHSLDILQANDTREVPTMETAVCKAVVHGHKPDEAVSVSSINTHQVMYSETSRSFTHKMIFRINVSFFLSVS